MENKKNKNCSPRCKEIKVCQKCNPDRFGDFRKVLELQDTSVSVFICNDEVCTKNNKGKQKQMKTYLVYNSGYKSVDRSEYLEELDKMSTQCTHCNATLKKMKILLDRDQIVKQKEIIGTCEHCRILPKPVKCKQCTALINKFLAERVRHYEKLDELYKGWMNDVNQIVSDFLLKKSKPKHREQTSLELKELLREIQSPIRSHEPEIKYFPASDIEAIDTEQTCEKNISLLKKIFSILEGDKPGMKENLEKLLGEQYVQEMPEELIIGLGNLTKHKMENLIGLDLTNKFIDRLLNDLGKLSKDKLMKVLGVDLTNDVLDLSLINLGLLSKERAEKILGTNLTSDIIDKFFLSVAGDKLSIDKLQKIFGTTIPKAVYEDILKKIEKDKLSKKTLEKLMGSTVVSYGLFDKALSNLGKFTSEQLKKCLGSHLSKEVENKLLTNIGKLNQEKSNKLFGSPITEKILEKILSHFRSQLTRRKLPTLIGSDLADEVLVKIVTNVEEKLTREKLEKIVGPSFAKEILNKIFRRLQGDKLTKGKLETLLGADISKDLLEKISANLENLSVDAIDNLLDLNTSTKVVDKILKNLGKEKFIEELPGSKESLEMIGALKGTRKKYMGTKRKLSERGSFSLLPKTETSLEHTLSQPKNVVFTGSEKPPLLTKPRVTDKSTQIEVHSLSGKDLPKAREKKTPEKVSKTITKSESKEQSTGDLSDESLLKQRPSRNKHFTKHVDKNQNKVISETANKNLNKKTPEKVSKRITKSKSKGRTTGDLSDESKANKILNPNSFQTQVKKAASEVIKLTEKDTNSEKSKTKLLTNRSDRTLQKKVTDNVLQSSTKTKPQEKKMSKKNSENKLVVDIIQPKKEDLFDITALIPETKENVPNETKQNKTKLKKPLTDEKKNKKTRAKQKTRVVKKKPEENEVAIEDNILKYITNADMEELDELTPKDYSIERKSKTPKLTSSTKELLKLLKDMGKERMVREKERSARERALKKIKMPEIKNLPKIPQKKLKPRLSSEERLVDSKTRSKEIAEMVKGIEITVPSKIRKLEKSIKEPKLFNVKPVFGPHSQEEKKVKIMTPPKLTLSEIFQFMECDDLKGIIRYKLSNPEFIDKGWTRLPAVKVMRRLNIYKMKPSRPDYDWFTKHKNRMLFYDTGEILAEVDSDGYGKWYYKNGIVALDYYKAKEPNVANRYVIYSSGEKDENGVSRNITMLACFDQIGNGIVLDHCGNERLKYNQTEGVILDEKIGPYSKWKWHSLNDPTVLKPVYLDNFPRKRNLKIEELVRLAEEEPSVIELAVTHKDTKKEKLLKQAQNEKIMQQAANDEMIGIELSNYVHEKTQKMLQHFQPFEIKAKFLKINEQFSLKIIDQGNIALHFRDGQTVLKQNIGLVLIDNEIVDTESMDLEAVMTPFDRVLPKSQSVENLLELIQFTKSRSKESKAKDY